MSGPAMPSMPSSGVDAQIAQMRAKFEPLARAKNPGWEPPANAKKKNIPVLGRAGRRVVHSDGNGSKTEFDMGTGSMVVDHTVGRVVELADNIERVGGAYTGKSTLLGGG